MTTYIYRDHIVTLKQKRSGLFQIKIKMPDGFGAVTADTSTESEEKARRIAAGIINTYTKPQVTP